MSDATPTTPLTIPADPPRLALRPKDAAAALGISERLLWSMTARREIPHLRIGRCVVYPVSELQRWLAERAEGGSDESR